MLFRPLIVAIDLDSTVCDLLSEWLGLYNAEYDDKLTAADMHDWEIANNVPIGKEVYKYLDDPHLYRRLNPYPGALESIGRMHQEGHQVQIISAPSEHEQTAADKIWWCRQHLPFLPRERINLVHHKERFHCDVLIDDSPKNIELHAQQWPESSRIGIAFPYNLKVAKHMDLRAPSFRDPAEAWKQFEAFVRGKAASRG